jgi:hypothetical protein
MSKQLTRSQFLQAGLGLGVLMTGCGDSGSGGAGGGPTAGGDTGGSPPTGGGSPPTSGGSPPSGGAPTSGGAPAEGGGGAAPSICNAALVALISNNHGHELTVPLADLDSLVDIEYDISGTSGHCHVVTLTAADFATLKGGGSVAVHTCNNTDHELTLSCATPPEPGPPDCDGTPQFGACG